ncbi:MAG: hypothetical protein V3W34_13620 [Phycisphaerae bacterium]
MTFDGAVGNPPPIAVANGLFTAVLDFGNVFDGDARWLQIRTRCPAGGGSFATLAPRQELPPGPYALFATKGPGGGGGFWAANADDIYNTNDGDVGIGTTEPTAKLDVRGSVRVRDNSGVQVQNSSGAIRARMSTNGDLGELYTFGPNGSTNFKATANGLAPNTGAMLIADANGNQRCGMYIDHTSNKGIVWGDTFGIGTTNPAGSMLRSRA